MSFFQALRFGIRLLINKRAVPGVCAIIRNSKGEILLGKRKRNALVYPDFWGLPGGLIEYNETVEDAIRREIREETGVNSKVIKYGKPVSQLPSKNFPFHDIALVVYCTIKGKPLAKDETQEVGWFSPKEIKNMDLAYNHKKILKQEKIL